MFAKTSIIIRTACKDALYIYTISVYGKY